MNRTRELTPILDRDLEGGDDYIAELGRRIENARSSNARRYAALSWIN